MIDQNAYLPETASLDQPLGKMAETYGYGALIEREEFALATRQYEHAIERREQLEDRVRFGALSLNGATLAALMGVFGDANKVLLSLGIGAEPIRTASLFLILGMAIGSASVWWSGVHFTNQAGASYVHLTKRRHRAALMECWRTSKTDAEYGRLLDEPMTDPLFKFSKFDMWLRNTSGSCWLGAMSALAIPLAQSMNWHSPLVEWLKAIWQSTF